MMQARASGGNGLSFADFGRHLLPRSERPVWHNGIRRVEGGVDHVGGQLFALRRVLDVPRVVALGYVGEEVDAVDGWDALALADNHYLSYQ